MYFLLSVVHIFVNVQQGSKVKVKIESAVKVKEGKTVKIRGKEQKRALYWLRLHVS